MNALRTNSFGFGFWALLLGFTLVLGCNGDNGNGEKCPNGTIDDGEDCDGSNLNEKTCADVGFDEGELACSSTCTFDTSNCTEASDCGNDTLEAGEDCDRTKFGDATCETLCYPGGELACTDDCEFDVSGCWDDEDCGNDTLDQGETCDRSKLNGGTCQDLGFVGGDLTCAANCEFNLCSCDWSGEDFQLSAGDEAIATAHNQTYDWETHRLAIRILAAPTQSEADKALFYRNPGRYKDTSNEQPITPDPQPDIAGGAASGFDFPLADIAPHPQAQVLVESSIKDSLADTPISSQEVELALMWEPAVTLFLVDWNIDKSLDLFYADTAVSGQKWGSSGTLAPQFIEHVYLHGNEIWLEVAFQKYVQLGAGVTDSDGDGYKEVVGKLNPDLYDQDVYDQLAGDYSTQVFDVNTLRDIVACAGSSLLDALYFAFPMVPLQAIGEPYDVPGQGTLEHPFMVIRGDNPQCQTHIVLLVRP